MISHLSSEQLSECIAGYPRPKVARHVEQCPACRAELARFREALGEFGGAVRAWSEGQAQAAMSAYSPAATPRSWAASHQLAWALAIAAIFVIASFLWPGHRSEGAAASDALLLNQVDAEVSRTVPASMEPLMKLVVENQ
jgi:anti-sigma factor RsiW